MLEVVICSTYYQLYLVFQEVFIESFFFYSEIVALNRLKQSFKLLFFICLKEIQYTFRAVFYCA